MKETFSFRIATPPPFSPWHAPGPGHVLGQVAMLGIPYHSVRYIWHRHDSWRSLRQTQLQLRS